MTNKLLLKKLVLKTKAGTAFYWQDFADSGFSKQCIQRILRLLNKEGLIEKKIAEIYYISFQTWVGRSVLSEEALLKKLILLKREKDRKRLGDVREDLNKVLPIGRNLF